MATALTPWKADSPAGNGPCRTVLQCGHGVNAVESFIVILLVPKVRLLQCGHGVNAVESEHDDAV